ncbi:CHRD domain-containing protein [Salegentibacter sp. HM20]
MKKLLLMAFIAMPFLFWSCDNDDDVVNPTPPEFEGESKVYELNAVANPDISGTAIFMENEDGTTTVEIELQNTPAGGTHPAHIHYGTAAEGGDIAVTFEPVDGDTGMSTTVVTSLDDGTSVTYEDLIAFDGYINVHLSADELETIVAQGDIGENELTGQSKSYMLGEKDVEGISGSILFEERVNGEAQATIMLDNTPEGGTHPAHIHMGTAVDGPGDIAFTFTPVNGDTGMSRTNVSMLDDDTPFMYNDILSYDGYVNVHLSADELTTIVAQGDIGENELTGESKTYELMEKDVEGIMGTATFEERVNGEALATISLQNTPDGGMHPAHIHMGAAVDGPGEIAFTFNPVNGTTGMSMTNVSMLDDDSEFMYSDVLEYDGYINVHLSADNLGTIVAQGDIGGNELTGESKTYELNSVAVPGIEGTATFEERMNGNTLVTLDVDNTVPGMMHPAHIHYNSAAEGGDIAISLNAVNGTTGMSMTNVEMLDDETAITYEELLSFDGYINVHLSAEDLGTIVAQGDIGSNELTGESVSYDLNSVDVPGIMGTATFEERMSGETLVTISLEGTPEGGTHPAHIHFNSAEEGGDIAISLNPVDGTTGMSMTQVMSLDGEDGDNISYEGLLEFDGYINVHLSADQLDVIVAQGDIGSNS